MSDSSDPLADEVVIWDLVASDHNPAAESLTIGPEADSHLNTILGLDLRELADPIDCRKGGRYYCKIARQAMRQGEIRYAGQVPDDTRWAQGTGWLIEPDVLVTAGHCAFDHTFRFGKASSIKAYVGYSGRRSLQQPDVQFRNGARALVPKGWAESNVNRQSDVAFIKLDKPFLDIRPFQLRATPSKGSEMIGIVGYPMDKSFDGERGGFMYEQFRKTNFDLNISALNMLEHQISTFTGQSGSPIIIKGSSAVIGIQVYGLGDRNAASVIRGEYGNPYIAYQTAINASSTTGNRSPGNGLPRRKAPVADNAEVEIESFIDVLKKVGRAIGSQASSASLAADQASKGQIDVVIAGTALGVVSTAARRDQADQVSDSQYRQSACRAIMAEAALQAVLRMDSQEAQDYGVMKKMGDIYSVNQNIISKVVPALAPSLTDPALSLAVSDDKQVERESRAPFPTIIPDTAESLDGSIGMTREIQDESKGVAQPYLEAFSPLSKDLHHVAIGNGESPESIKFLDQVSSASDKAGPTDLRNLGSCLETIIAHSASIKSPGALQPDQMTLFQRAFLGEAALQTIDSMSSEVRVNGFIDLLHDVHTKIAPKLGERIAERVPDLIEFLNPLIEKVNSGNKAPLAPAPVPILGRPAKSILDLLNGNS